MYLLVKSRFKSLNRFRFALVWTGLSKYTLVMCGSSLVWKGFTSVTVYNRSSWPMVVRVWSRKSRPWVEESRLMGRGILNWWVIGNSIMGRETGSWDEDCVEWNSTGIWNWDEHWSQVVTRSHDWCCCWVEGCGSIKLDICAFRVEHRSRDFSQCLWPMLMGLVEAFKGGHRSGHHRYEWWRAMTDGGASVRKHDWCSWLVHSSIKPFFQSSSELKFLYFYNFCKILKK